MMKLGKIFKWLLYLALPLVGLYFLFKKEDEEIQTGDKYKYIAAELFACMDRFGTNEAKMFSLLKSLSGWDLWQVYEAFGRRKYQGFGESWVGTELDLFGWFEEELSEKDLTQMRSIWVKSGLFMSW